MPYSGALIKGERAMEKYCMKRWGELPRFTETIGHCGEATIEYHCWPDKDGQDHAYYLLYMPDPKGNYYNTSNIRRNFYEAVRNGTARLLNP